MAQKKRDTQVLKVHRWGRSLQHLLNVIAEFKTIGVPFISLRDNLDLSTPSGRLTFELIGSMAHFERDLLSLRAG